MSLSAVLSIPSNVRFGMEICCCRDYRTKLSTTLEVEDDIGVKRCSTQLGASMSTDATVFSWYWCECISQASVIWTLSNKWRTLGYIRSDKYLSNLFGIKATLDCTSLPDWLLHDKKIMLRISSLFQPRSEEEGKCMWTL